MSLQSFSKKWADIKHRSGGPDEDEGVLFVAPGKNPVTQRQLNLYYYYLFIKDILGTGAKSVLEIGCGRGTMSLYLGRYLGCQVSLLDNASDAIEIAKREFQERKQSAQFFVDDALNTKIPSDSFDAVISIGLAEHIDDVKKLFAEEFRLLKKDGVMISLNIPKKVSVQYLNIIYRFVKKICGQYKESIKKDYYRNNLQASDYYAIAKEVGFESIQITHVCPFPVYAPMGIQWDKRITIIRKVLLKVRSVFQKYPYKTNSIGAQAHFLVAYKK